MRPAAIADYSRLLMDRNYLPDALQCARAIVYDIVSRCPCTFLDYGCGRGQLVDWINSKTKGHATGWDPARGGPRPTIEPDWIISCDVLEHIPEDDIPAVLDWMHEHARRGLLLTIANMSDVAKIDGEDVQLHLIRQNMNWWTELMHDRWPGALIEARLICANGDRFAIIVEF